MSRLFRGGNNAPACRGGPGTTRVVRRGPTLADVTQDAQPPSQERIRGASLGLPAEGPGSLAGFGTRVAAFMIDAIAAALVAGIFTAPSLPGNWSMLSFGLITAGTLAVFGQTPGMRLFGLRLAHPRQGQRLAPWRAVVRTALLMLLVPALLVDYDGRGLHDRLTGTAVVRN